MDRNHESYGRTWAGFAEAFSIFAKYGDGLYRVCAEHDEIFAGPDDVRLVSQEDTERLAFLGWKPAEDVGGFRTFT